MIEPFLSECREYCEKQGWSLATLGNYAVRDSRLFRRLEAGGQCMPRTMERVREFIAKNPAPETSGKTDREDAAA